MDDTDRAVSRLFRSFKTVKEMVRDRVCIKRRRRRVKSENEPHLMMDYWKATIEQPPQWKNLNKRIEVPIVSIVLHGLRDITIHLMIIPII